MPRWHTSTRVMSMKAKFQHKSRNILLISEFCARTLICWRMGPKNWVSTSGGNMVYFSGEKIPPVPGTITCQSEFSARGKHTSHSPLCDWLRSATAFLKWHANVTTNGRDDKTCNTLLKCKLTKMVIRIRQEDPVRGNWYVCGQIIKVWVNVSFLGTGVPLAVDGTLLKMFVGCVWTETCSI